MENTKWYVGMGEKEIISEMSRLAHEALAHYINEEVAEGIAYEHNFDTKFESVMDAIVEIKSVFWSDKKCVAHWEKVQADLWTIRNGLKNYCG